MFNISESLLFITKSEVIGSLHNFLHTIFFMRLLNQKLHTALLQPVNK